MKVVKLFLPGRFEEAYAYMGRLVVLTEEQTIRTYGLDEIVDLVQQRYPDLVPVPELMFSRNDWLVGEAFDRIIRNRGMIGAMLQAFDSFPQPFLDLSRVLPTTDDHQLGIRTQFILDMMIYNRRLYLGSDSGFYHIDMSWEQDITLGAERKRLDASCISSSAKYGAVNASCGDDGLFTAFDDFRQLEREGHNVMRDSSRSVKSSWMGHDIVNYSSITTPVLLRSQFEPRDKQRDRSVSGIVTGLSDNTLDLGDYLFELVREKYQIEPESIQYVYNSDRLVFIHTLGGQFYSLRISEPEPNQLAHRLQFTQTYKGANTQFLSVHEVAGKLTIEAYDRILLFHRGQWTQEPIVIGEALSVETFPRSLQYKNLATVVLEDGLLSVGVFDDSRLSPGVE